MRRLTQLSSFVWILVLLVPGLALAEGTCDLDQRLEKIAQETDQLIYDGDRQPDEALLFFQLPKVLLPGESKVTLTVEAAGKVVLVEEIQAVESVEADAPEGVVELLAGHPRQLAGLRQLADQGRAAEVLISLDGEVLEKMSLEQLLLSSSALRAALPEPSPVTSTLTVDHLAPARATESDDKSLIESLNKSACTDYCDEQFDDCIAYRCNYTWCSGCQNEFEDCLESCGVCQPSSSSTTQLSVVSVTPQGPVECHTHYFFGKDLYIWTKVRYKQTVTTTTINSDCTQTVSSTVTYFNAFCWKFYAFSPSCFEIYPTSNFC